MDEPEAEGHTAAADAVGLGELVGAQSVALLRVVALLVPGLAAAASASLLDEVWAEYLASLFKPGEGVPVASGLLAVLVSRCRALSGSTGSTAPDPLADPMPGPDPVPAERFRPDQDRWAGAWRVGRGPRAWAEDPRRTTWTREAVESLPLPVREVLVLRDTAGLSTDEVGAVLQRPAAEVRSLLHRGRMTVWAELERRLAEAGQLQPPAAPPAVSTTAVAVPASEPYPGDPGHRLICRRLVELLTEYLEGTLDATLTNDLEAHLAVCPECRLFVQQVQAAATQSGGLEAVHRLPPALVETVVRRLERILQTGRS